MSKIFDRAFFVDLATGNKPPLDKPTSLKAVGTRPTLQVNVKRDQPVAATRLRVIRQVDGEVVLEKTDKWAPYRVVEDSASIDLKPGKYELEATPLNLNGDPIEGASSWPFAITPSVDGEPGTEKPDQLPWSQVGGCISLDEIDTEQDAQKLAAMARLCGVTIFRTFGPSLTRNSRPSRDWVKKVNWLTAAGMRVAIMVGPKEGDRSNDPQTLAEWTAAIFYLAQDAKSLLHPAMIIWEGPNEIDLKQYFNRYSGKANYSFDLNVVRDVMWVLTAMRHAFGPNAFIIGPSIGMPIASLHKQYMTALVNAGMMRLVNAANDHGYFDNAADFLDVNDHYLSLGIKIVYWSEIEPRGSTKDQANAIAVIRRFGGRPLIYRFTTRPRDKGQKWDGKCLHDQQWKRNESAIVLWGLN